MEQPFEIYVNGNTYSCDELVPPDIAARFLGVSRRTLRRLTSQRAIPVYRYNDHSYRYLVSDLVEYADQHRCDALP